MMVNDLMTKQVVSIGRNQSAAVAGRLMWESDCGAVPVTDDDGRVVGMLTDRDICMAAVLGDHAPSAIVVSEAMSRTLHFCSPADSVGAAEQVMRANQIRRLPVLDADRRLLGILSLADVVRGTQTAGKVKAVPAHEVTATLADICAPRRAPAGPPARKRVRVAINAGA